MSDAGPTHVSGPWRSAPATQEICGLFTKAGLGVYFVGGCVRNALIGAPVGDIDLTTEAPPETVLALAEAAGIRAVPTGLAHGTITLIAEDTPFEVTSFRRDIRTDGRHAEVVFGGDMAADAHRRDFTMNALYADPSGRLFDPVGGLADLMARRVRFIGAAEARIREDYLRILRFFRFHAWYGASDDGLDAEALAGCAALQEGLARISRERIGAEMRKLLAAPDPGPALGAMAASGILGRLLPGASIAALGPLVALEAEQGLPPDPICRLAALGGTEAAARLRLSRSEARRLAELQEAAAAPMGAGELGYRLGEQDGLRALLLRASGQGGPLDAAQRAELARGAGAVFPVAAADLMPALSGPALGRRLRWLESRWIRSGFTLSKRALLDLSPPG